MVDYRFKFNIGDEVYRKIDINEYEQFIIKKIIVDEMGTHYQCHLIYADESECLTKKEMLEKRIKELQDELDTVN